MRWAGHVEKRKSYRILVGKPEGRTPLEGCGMIILLRFRGEYRWGMDW
jgi:hypothetical protein